MKTRMLINIEYEHEDFYHAGRDEQHMGKFLERVKSENKHITYISHVLTQRRGWVPLDLQNARITRQ